MASPQFAAEAPAVKQSIIAQILSATHAAAKVDLFGQRPISVSAGGLRGPTVRGPSALELGSILQGRQMGLIGQ